MLFKTVELGIKDVNEAKGIVEGYASAFGNVDSDGDVIQKGAFARTIKQRGPEGKNLIYHLAQHNSTSILGLPEELKEDNNGLYFRSQISKTNLGKDYIQLYLDGVIKQHSIGFQTLDSKKDGDNTVLTELKLWEYSSVTWGANEDTPTISAKSATAEDAVEYIGTLTKAIRNGKYTDETFHLLEYELDRISTLFKSLTRSSTDTGESPPDDTSTPDLDFSKIFKTLENGIERYSG